MSATVKVALKDWPAYVRKLGERANVAMKRGIVAGVHRCIPLLQRRTEQAVPASANGGPGAFNTGAYRGGWRVRDLERGAAVYNTKPYAGIIDGGRRPGRFPPLQAIRRWAQRRLGLADEEARQAAYPIARAIARRGLRPRAVLSGATQEMTNLVTVEANRELLAEMARP